MNQNWSLNYLTQALNMIKLCRFTHKMYWRDLIHIKTFQVYAEVLTHVDDELLHLLIRFSIPSSKRQSTILLCQGEEDFCYLLNLHLIELLGQISHCWFCKNYATRKLERHNYFLRHQQTVVFKKPIDSTLMNFFNFSRQWISLTDRKSTLWVFLENVEGVFSLEIFSHIPY